ncbi:MAG: hypothetical protein PUC65_02725, partial [Clostridiales bacterium]|nr:hypothetical protein [Clostridiales bacterium]
DSSNNSLTVTDLLLDVTISKEGKMNVLDLNELADCVEQSLIDKSLLLTALRSADTLFSMIADGSFEEAKTLLSSYESSV